jgi:hypothetical protein
MTSPLNLIAAGHQVLHFNSLAVITDQWAVIRDLNQKSYTIVPLASVTDLQIVKVCHLPLVVFAVASFVVAAAAHCSKQGGGADLPCGVIGIIFVIAFAASRRASVIFEINSESTRTAFGTVREAAKLIAAVRSIMSAGSQLTPTNSLLPEIPMKVATVRESLTTAEYLMPSADLRNPSDITAHAG